MKRYIDIFNTEFVTPGLNGFRTLDLRHPIQAAKKIYTHFMADSLYRNSIYMILSNFIMAFLGFFFWIINSRLYTPEQVGIATTLISVMTLISSFSNLGLNIGLVRFLSNSENKNALINSSFLVSSVMGFILSLGFLLGVNIFSPKLTFLRENILYAASFMLFVIAFSNNIIVESIFTAYRSAKFTLIKNSSLSILKLALPLLLLSYGAYGIFAALGVAITLSLFLSLTIMIRFFSYNMRMKPNLNEVRTISRYSFGNYIAGFIGGLPSLLLPILITNKLGPQETAYYYIAFMIASFIFMIPISTTNSLFAEGSYDDETMKTHIIKAVKITALILLPVIIVFMLFGNIILLAFGKNYSLEAIAFLKLLLILSIFISINTILATAFRIWGKIKVLILIGALNTIIVLTLSYFLIQFKLIGIGIAWLISNVIIIIINLFILLRIKKL